jgi:hypothetical protein
MDSNIEVNLYIIRHAFALLIKEQEMHIRNIQM